jgi:hypothetical protein
MNDKVQARKAVLVSTGLLLLIAAYRQKQGETEGSIYKRLWGVGMVGFLLSIAADFVPTIAGPFAVLIVLGSLTNGGDQAIQTALGKVAVK